MQMMLGNDLMDEMCLDKYDSCVDYMFEYREWEKNFCVSTMKAIDMLRHWAMFEEESKSGNSENDRKDFEKLMKGMKKRNICKKAGKNPGLVFLIFYCAWARSS